MGVDVGDRMPRTVPQEDNECDDGMDVRVPPTSLWAARSSCREADKARWRAGSSVGNEEDSLLPRGGRPESPPQRLWRVDESGETPPSQKDALAHDEKKSPRRHRGANRLSRAGELDEGQGEHLGRAQQIVDVAVLVDLVGELEDAGPVGDGVLEASDAGDVLLVVGAGARDDLGLAPEDFGNRLPERGDERRVRPGSGRGAPPSSPRARSALRGWPRRPSSRAPRSRVLVLSKPSSRRNRRSKTAEQRSATQGD